MNNKYPTTKPSLNLDFANTKSLDPRITFRRGTPGTYYDGVIHVKAEENLIDYSEDFANAYWRVNQITITTGHSSPDGGSTARKLAPTSGTSNKFIEIESGGGQNDFPDLGNLHFAASVFAKAGEKKYIKFATVDTNLTRRNDVIVDLSDGSIIESINNDETQYSVESAGGDWYRIGITGFGMQQLQVLVLGDDLSTNAAGDGTSGIYLWGAQLEQRDGVTAYTKTEGAPVTKYQPKLMTAAADRARFDHDPITGESKGLLIEESRTNLISYSEDFDTWSLVSASLEEGVVSPDGFSGGYFLRQNSSSGQHLVYTDNLANSGVTFAASVYIKSAGVDCKIGLSSVYSGESIKFNLATKEFYDATNIISSDVKHVGNDWYRCSFVFASSNDSNGLGIYLLDDNDQWSFTGDGSTGVYVWGAQLEAGSFSTSYIKTTGASATRSADNVSITGENFSSWYRQDEGSVYLEAKYNGGSGEAPYQRGVLGFTVGGKYPVTESIIFYNRNGYSSGLGINKNDVYSVLLSGGKMDDFDYFKSSFAYKENDVSLAANLDSGPQSLTDDTCEIPYLNSLILGSIHEFDDEKLNGHIKKIAYYPQRLTNEQLQNLTK